MSQDARPAGIESFRAARNERNAALVRCAIDDLLARDERVSFYNVAEKSGLSRSTLYRNETFRSMVEHAREDPREQVGIGDLMAQVRDLRLEIERLQRASGSLPSLLYMGVGLRAMGTAENENDTNGTVEFSDGAVLESCS